MSSFSAVQVLVLSSVVLLESFSRNENQRNQEHLHVLVQSKFVVVPVGSRFDRSYEQRLCGVFGHPSRNSNGNSGV